MSDDSDYIRENWIDWFCSIEDHFFFAKVDTDYIEDRFNLHGLEEEFKHYHEALNMILNEEIPDDSDLNDQQFLQIYHVAIDLYGLIHKRYINSRHGLKKMRAKFLKGEFGSCRRVQCQNQHVLPIGISEKLSVSRVKVFCPRCKEIYLPEQKCQDIDGAYFGTSFPNVLLNKFPDLVVKSEKKDYHPRIYGFKIYKEKGSKYYEEEGVYYQTYFDEKPKMIDNK